MNKISFEDLKKYNGFDEIDEKVRFISKNRHFCEYFIRELNQAIDLDYVKQSELLEENKNHELSGFILDDNTKVLRSEPKLPIKELLNAKTEEEYHEITDRQHDESTLVLVKNKPDGSSEITQLKTPSHLKAVTYALRQARKERKIYASTGEMPELNPSFIKKINEFIMSKLLEYGPIVGYGDFRHSIWSNGAWFTSNVRIKGDPWIPTNSDDVEDAMNAIMEEYNNSDLHPILKAIVFKVRFIQIHPFRDGNGRTSRILLNYMLVRSGIPTVTIRGSQKERYLNAMYEAVVNDDYANIVNIIKKLLNQRCDKYIEIIKETANEHYVTL